jgi:hypothetical protein
VKVFAKTKNYTKFDSDTACMMHALSFFFLQNITFWEDKKNICVLCSNVRIQLPLDLKRRFCFRFFRENFRFNTNSNPSCVCWVGGPLVGQPDTARCFAYRYVFF